MSQNRSTARRLYPAKPEILAILERSLKHYGTKELVSQATGRSRTAISLYMRNKYPAIPTDLEAAIVEALGTFECPWRGERVTDEICNTRFNALPPSSSPDAFKDWQACQKCLLRKELSHE